jgi:hypothetical protein
MIRDLTKTEAMRLKESKECHAEIKESAFKIILRIYVVFKNQ